MIKPTASFQEARRWVKAPGSCSGSSWHYLGQCWGCRAVPEDSASSTFLSPKQHLGQSARQERFLQESILSGQAQGSGAGGTPPSTALAPLLFFPIEEEKHFLLLLIALLRMDRAGWGSPRPGGGGIPDPPSVGQPGQRAWGVQARTCPTRPTMSSSKKRHWMKSVLPIFLVCRTTWITVYSIFVFNAHRFKNFNTCIYQASFHIMIVLGNQYHLPKPERNCK